MKMNKHIECDLVRDWKAEKKDLEEAFARLADKLVKAQAEIRRLQAEERQ